MALVPVTRNIPIERSSASYFQPSWQLGEWNNFMSPQQMMPMMKPPEPMPSMEKAMQEMNQQMVQMQTQMNRVMQDFQKLFPTDFQQQPMQPLQDGMQNSYVTDPEGHQRFRLTFDVRPFRPEELDIRTNAQTLSVYAAREESANGGRYKREYRRSILLPLHVNPKALQSVLSPEGVLTVEGPVSGKRLAIQNSGPVITPLSNTPGSTLTRSSLPQAPAPIITLPQTPASTLTRAAGKSSQAVM